MNEECGALIRSALLTYGTHTPQCESWLWELVDGPKPLFGGCNCGYAALTLPLNQRARERRLSTLGSKR